VENVGYSNLKNKGGQEMFSNRRVRLALGRTINLGNFESTRVDVEISADVEDSANLLDAQEALFSVVKEELDKRVEELSPKPKNLPRGRLITEEGD